MNETTKDTERRQRLHDWFMMNPEIWADIATELDIGLHNEALKLKSREPTCREWSAGYVYAIGEMLDMERYYRKAWIPMPSHQQK